MIHETLKVNGNINEWLKKSEESLHLNGFENVICRGLKGEVEGTYNLFDTIFIHLTPTIDGKVELQIESSKPELIEMYKNGVLNANPQKPTFTPPPEQGKPINYAPRFEQSRDFVNKNADSNSSSKTHSAQKSNGGCLKIGLIMVAVVVILVLLFSCVGSSGTPALLPKSEYTQNETANIKGINITLLNVTEDYGDGVFIQPDDGNIFVTCEFHIDNQSKEDIVVSSLMSFSAYCDGYAVPMNILGSTASSRPQLDGNVAAGKKMDGVITYQVPASWIELEINYEIDPVSGKSVKFIAKNV